MPSFQSVQSSARRIVLAACSPTALVLFGASTFLATYFSAFIKLKYFSLAAEMIFMCIMLAGVTLSIVKGDAFVDVDFHS